MTVDPRYPALAAGITAFVVGAIFVGDPVPTDLATIDAPVYATGTPVPVRETVRPVTLPLTANTSGAAPLEVPVSLAAPLVTRGAPVTDGPPPTPPVPAAGDCGAWRPLLELYGIPYDEALPYMQRESNCSNAYNGNAGTGDNSYGVLQVNRYGQLAAWWDEGGYTVDVMRTAEGAVAAAAVLYHSCRWGSWQPPYDCDGDYLQTPSPRWGEWPHQKGNQP